jgi:hypothetical protein
LKLKRFRKLSEVIYLPINIGLVGRCENTQQPEWAEDVSAQAPSNFLRLESAREAGLHAALAYPVPLTHIDGTEFHMVVVLWRSEIAKDSTATMRAVGSCVDAFVRATQGPPVTAPSHLPAFMSPSPAAAAASAASNGSTSASSLGSSMLGALKRGAESFQLDDPRTRTRFE